MKESTDERNALGLEGKVSSGGALINHAEQERRVRVTGQGRVRRQVSAGSRIRVEVQVHQVRKDSDSNVITVLRAGLQIVRAPRLRHLAAERVVVRMLIPVAALAVA